MFSFLEKIHSFLFFRKNNILKISHNILLNKYVCVRIYCKWESITLTKRQQLISNIIIITVFIQFRTYSSNIQSTYLFKFI